MNEASVNSRMTDMRLAPLVAYVQADRRVCPMPASWNQLWEMLPDRRRVGSGWEPPLPLILGAWSVASLREKRQRLVEHIEYSAQRGVLEEVDKFLRELASDDWLYESDIGS